MSEKSKYYYDVETRDFFFPFISIFIFVYSLKVNEKSNYDFEVQKDIDMI